MAYGLKSDTEDLRRKILALRKLPDDGSYFSPGRLRAAYRPLSWAAIGERLGISAQLARKLGVNRKP